MTCTRRKLDIQIQAPCAVVFDFYTSLGTRPWARLKIEGHAPKHQHHNCPLTTEPLPKQVTMLSNPSTITAGKFPCIAHTLSYAQWQTSV